ncbi:type II toxin-antitoxin system VapB family antitoxin [Spirulina major]|uniref:type II toxin-antitoxin system VapB family antitoxin n=1 Tax=Spirulina major TaxID=270636 RepID=UPI000933D14E|nr:type II toxin-antitoxin system VapB family antitoxin [Spirulina major]
MQNTPNIDETILAEALALSNNQTPEDVLKTALQEYIQRRRQLQIIELFNTIDYDPDYDYKQQRHVCFETRFNA